MLFNIIFALFDLRQTILQIEAFLLCLKLLSNTPKGPNLSPCSCNVAAAGCGIQKYAAAGQYSKKEVIGILE
jgi:hypothetical protein